ncbi:hypothetical protein Bca4012_035673 [Brassica carinata]
MLCFKQKKKRTKCYVSCLLFDFLSRPTNMTIFFVVEKVSFDDHQVSETKNIVCVRL